MSNRKNLKIDSQLYDRLAKAKGSTDTWDEFLGRLLNSVEEGQVHFDRATLENFGDDNESTRTLLATDQGEIQVRFVDKNGDQIGSTTLATLSENQRIELEVEEGDWVDD